MKNLFLSSLLLLTFSCKKEIAPAAIPVETKEPNTTKTDTMPADMTVKDQTLVLSADFMAAAHSTVGSAKIYEDNKTKKQTLVFEGFKTDAGPDLKIYLAEDTKANNFVQISDNVKNGNSVYELPATFDVKKQIYVLIWCKQFSVLFGSAKLK